MKIYILEPDLGPVQSVQQGGKEPQHTGGRYWWPADIASRSEFISWAFLPMFGYNGYICSCQDQGVLEGEGQGQVSYHFRFQVR